MATITIKTKGKGKHPKVGGIVIAKFAGFTVHGEHQDSENRKGHDRLWIQIRQADPEQWASDVGGATTGSGSSVTVLSRAGCI